MICLKSVQRRERVPRGLSQRNAGRGLIAALWVSLLAVPFVTVESALAQDFSGGAVQEKKFPMTGRHELSPRFLASVNNTYTSSLGIGLQYLYHINEYFAVGADFSYLFSRETSLVASRTQPNLPSLGDPGNPSTEPCSSKDCVPLQPQRRQPQMTASVDLQIKPIYGKLNFLSEFNLRWDLYLQVGGGGVYSFLEAPPNFATGVTGGAAGDQTFRPGGHVGGGFRFYINKLVAIRFEVKNWIYPESGIVEIKNGVKNPDPTDPKTSEGPDVTQIRNLTLLGVGVSLMF
jgi:outer membrane beta-barrel protein